MAQTLSIMVPLGTAAPDFSLPDVVSGSTKRLADVKGKNGTVVMFICNHCPYVKLLNAGFISVAKTYQQKGIGFVAISSNDVKQYPDDGPAEMKTVARTLGYPFPYLFDESQSVARAYDAACTPDLYLYDADLKLYYRGQFDDARPGKDVPVTGIDLMDAMDRLLAGSASPEVQRPSVGCNIKWTKAD